MNRFLQVTAAAVISLLIQPAFAQQPAAGAKDAQPVQPAPNPQDVDKQFAKMQEQMTKMQAQMDKIRQAKDAQERQRLLQEHWTTMQETMTLMHGGWSGMMGCCAAGPHMTGGPMMGGHMMGGPMMHWGEYRNLTPEQLKQRQYMMDRWMPMQQMMMDQMMQHHSWMMQPQPPTPASK